MIARLYILIIALWLFVSSAWGQQLSVEESVKRANDAIEQYKREAVTMSSSEIYRELEKSQEMIRLKQRSRTSLAPDITDSDTQKGIGFAQVLGERRKASDPEAAFYFGLYEMQVCFAVKQVKDVGNSALKICNDAADSFRVAITANDPRAMRALGVVYREGLGVTISKFVAADWFVKSARQYRIENARENALSVVEEALVLVPDHPEALAIRNELLK